MLLRNEIDVTVFDCDGVIFDSNGLKINAMENALRKVKIPKVQIERCVEYFSNNFGKSRFSHIEYFCNNILQVSKAEFDLLYNLILYEYSESCYKLYLKAELTPGIEDVLTTLGGEVYVASGSEEGELKKIFKKRNLDLYFSEIFGSPTRKDEILKRILNNKVSDRVLMIGDAFSDWEASRENNVRFIAYLKYSTVREKMIKLSKREKFPYIDTWKDFELACSTLMLK